MSKSLQIGKALIIISSILLLAGCGQNGPKPPGKYADVAKCLKEKGVVMYGAYWCPHCADQKSFFGDDFQFVAYQECDDSGTNGDHKKCLAAGVSSYPTWIFPGQGNLPGEQPVYLLAKLANCEDKLPDEDKQKLADALKKADEAKKTAPVTTPAASATTGTQTAAPSAAATTVQATTAGQTAATPTGNNTTSNQVTK